MARIDLDKFEVSELFRHTMPDPLRRDRPYHERLEALIRHNKSSGAYSEEYRLSALIFGRPSLVGYLISEVQKGRSEMHEDRISSVFRTYATCLAGHIVNEGGRAAVVMPSRSDREAAVMNVGKYVLVHDRTWPNYGGGDTSTMGPVGDLVISDYSTVEGADVGFNNTLEIFEKMLGGHVLEASTDKIQGILREAA